MKNKIYDVAIYGGGIVGPSLAYFLTRYTDISRVILAEQYDKIATVNSSRRGNSQTVHATKMETNIGRAKAFQIWKAAMMLIHYMKTRHSIHGVGLYKKMPHMVLGVGDEEIALLEDRYMEFKGFHRDMRMIGKEEIERLEPNVVRGRSHREKIAAHYSCEGYAADYMAVANSLIADALAEKESQFDLAMGTKLIRLSCESDGTFRAETNRGIIRSQLAVVTAGAHSLHFAHDLGIGLEYSVFPVAGNFYYAKRKLVTAKCYTVQNLKTPFAAIHADPDVHDENFTRFGPTTKWVPMLERHRYGSVVDYLKSISPQTAVSLAYIMSDFDLLRFMLKNASYLTPILGKLFFLKSAQKIIPALRYRDLAFAHGVGGIRPQLINNKTRTLEHGTGTLKGERSIFCVTPSPGATKCLGTGLEYALWAVDALKSGGRFDFERLFNDFPVLAEAEAGLSAA